MTNYVNEAAFFAWYDRVAAEPRPGRAALLEDLARKYRESRREEYILPPEKTRSGREERYPFRYENVGCCGASTVFFYF